MDPQACLERWRSAVRIDDEEEAYEAAHDLVAWLDRGGFQPKWKDSSEVRALRADALQWKP